MSFYRLLLRSLRRPSTTTTLPITQSLTSLHVHCSNPNIPLHLTTPTRTFAFSSAEEAAAERRRRKRRLRIEPPLNALRRDSRPPPPRDPNAPRLPDTTSALVGPRLNLHNRVQSLIRAGDLDAASEVARHSVFSNTRPTVFTCNAIVAAMYRAKRYNDAIALFHFFFNQSNIVPNIVSYNNLINTHCDEGRVDVGLEIYRHIIANCPYSPSPVTYRHLTKGLVDAGRIGEGVDLLREMLNKGHGADSLVFNNLIKGFLHLENMDKAVELFDELKERCLVYDGVVNSTFMDWFFNQGKEKEAMESYKSLLDRQFRMVPATCNVLLEVLLKHGKKKEAWDLFDQMLDNHTPPNFQAVNSETFNIMVNECFKLGKCDEAIATFKKVGTKVNSRPFSMDVAGYNNIIARYCENGMLPEAETLFAELSSKSLTPDVMTHRTLIDAYLKVERIDDALKIFSRMVEVGLRVVASLGKRVFDELIKNGKAVDCAQILKKMGEKDPKPDASFYDAVIKGVCNEGVLDTGCDLLEEMVRYGIGVPPELQQFVNEVFGEAGRGEEIQRVLNTNRWGYRSLPRDAPPQQFQPRSPQMAGQYRPSSAPPQMTGQYQPPSGPYQPPFKTENPKSQKISSDFPSKISVMEDSREILLKSLENSGVCLPDDVSSVKDLTPATLVSICAQSLNLIGRTAPFPTSLPDSSVGDQFKLCTDIASGIKSLGYLADLSFHQFLYPSEEDSYKLIRFLVERLSDLSEVGEKAGPKGVSDKREVKEDGFQSSLEDHKTRDEGPDLSHEKSRTKLDKVTLIGEVPEIAVNDVCSSSMEGFNKDRQTNVFSGNHSTEKVQNQEQLLMEEVKAKTSEQEHLEEELKLLKEAADMAFDVHHSVEFHLEKLNEQVDVRKHHLGELISQWEAVRKPLEEKMKSLQESVYANNPYAQEKLQKLKDYELEKESILSEIRKREEEISKLSTDLEKQPKLSSRRSYIERVKEITKNSRKQEADIEQILKDTRELQLESNSIQERLHRTYAVVDEMVFREAKKDAVGRQAYRLLTSIHESFEQIREKILATDRTRREVGEHEKKLAAMASRSLNVDKLQADLDAIRRENEYVEKCLRG